jgi:hypothetical protein
MLDEFGRLEEPASIDAQETWLDTFGSARVSHAAVAVEQFLAEVYSRYLTS